MPSPDTKPSQDTGSLYAAPETAYFEGRFVPVDEARISVKTHGFLYGTSVFEGIRGYYLPETGQMSIFQMRPHYERLLNNGRVFYLTTDALGLDVDRLMALTVELVARNKPRSDVYIRPTLYKSEENITPLLQPSETQFCVWTKPMGAYLDLAKGLNVCVSSWRRLSDNALPPRGKAGGAYMSTALAVTDARLNGFDDAVFLTEAGMVSEGSAMNLFLVKDGTLVTPSADQNILPGITRHAIITLAREVLGVDTVSRPVDRSELYYADEAFFCGTGAQIAPITSFDRRPVGRGADEGRVGPITSRLQSLYFDVVKNRHADYGHWCTLVDVS